MRKRNPEELIESGVEWIGKIPRDWHVYKIKFTTYLKGRVGWHGLTTGEYKKRGPYLVTGTDFAKGVVNWDSCHHVSEERYSQDPYIHLKEGDLLITKDGTIGKTALVKNLSGKATLNTGVFLIRPHSDFYNTRYMYWLLNSKVFNEYIEYSKSGSTVAHLYQETFSNWKFPAPTHNEQIIIATFLDRKTSALDRLIEKKQQLIEKLKEKRQALITRAVTKGLDPDAPMKDSGIEWLGEIPESWEITKLKWVSNRITTGKTPKTSNESYFSDSEVLWYSPSDFNNDYQLNESDRKISFEAVKDLGIKLYKAESVLIVGIGATVGKLGITNKKSFSNQQINAIEFNKNMVNPWFGLYQIAAFKDYIISLASANTLPIFNQSDTKNLLFLKPSKNEQDNIISEIQFKSNSIFESIKLIEDQIQKFKEYRQSLISAAVTGKIDVRDDISTSVSKEPTKEISGWDKFNLAIEIIKQMQDNRHFGRIMLVKILFIIEYHLRINGFKSRYKRWDHGPFDNRLINSIEHRLKKDDWIQIDSKDTSNYSQNVYTPTQKAYEKGFYFENSWGDLKSEIEAILRIFKKADSRQAEIIVTTYAAYNDLLIENKEPTEKAVVDEIVNHWHPDKKKISKQRWRSAYHWIKENNFIPTGFGNSTKKAT